MKRFRTLFVGPFILMASLGTVSSGFAQSETLTQTQIQTQDQTQTQTQAQVPTLSARAAGILLEKGTKKPLADINVFVLPAKLKATTDAQGRFSFDTLPEGELQFVVTAPGYVRLELRETVAAGAILTKRLYLERETYQGFETTVLDRKKKRDDTTRSMPQEQFLTVPGAQGDPVKAVQNLPGIARPQAGGAQVIIQGSAPEDTAYLLDDHDVPLVFHFGGLTSIITPEAVDQVDYLSAGYGPEYGRALGGVIGLQTRDPDADRMKGFVFADTMKAGGLIEGPIDAKSSYLLSARYSYLGLILKEVLKDNDEFNLTVAPSFADVSGIYTRKNSDQNKFKLLTIASRDELKFLFNEPVRDDPSIRGSFSMLTQFYRFVPQWELRHDSETSSRWSLGLGQDQVKVEAGDNFFNVTSNVLTQRGEVETKIRPTWTTYLGMDNSLSWYDVRLRIPTATDSGDVRNPVSSGELQELKVDGSTYELGAYWRNTVRPSGTDWTLMPSIRADYFDSTGEFRPAPRLGLRYDVDPSLFWRAAGGLYHQSPLPQEINDQVGNPDLKAPSAWHATTGMEKDFRGGTTRGWVISSGVFYRSFDNLVIPSAERDGSGRVQRYSNEGAGEAYGAELLLRLEAKPWTGWLSYTLSRSTRTEPGQGRHVFEYDQTHNVNFVTAVDLTENWKISGRVRYVTGNPYTPVGSGIFDADNDTYIPVRGPFFSERLDPFFQADIRVDKKWVFENWILWGYLDIQNLTNSRNPEAIQYAYDYSERQTVTGLPILPTLGLRGDF